MGNELNNSLTGNAANNTLTGGLGNDTLSGGVGADTMIGGAGDDSYYIDNAGDTVIELAGEGNDILYSSVTYTLGANVERLYLTGAADVNASGNELANTLYGHANTGANVLTGGLGNDVYYAGVNDSVVELAGEGTDSVYSYGDYTLSANVENLYLNVVSAATLTGNDLANSLRGNAGDDLLTGGLGNDTLNGGAGNDVLQGGAGNDTVTDTVGNNLLDGGLGNDALTDGDGDSWLAGGAGNDTLNLGRGADVVAFNRGDGADTLLFGAEAAANDALSLGHGIQYADLRLRKSGNNLIVDLGQGDSLMLQNWYGATPLKTVSQLQIIGAAGGYQPNDPSNPTGQPIEVFDFAKLVQNFDAAVAQNAGNANGWAAMNSLLDAHLSGSSTQALGGDLSFQYASAGTLAAVGLMAAQSSVATGSTQWQGLSTHAQVGLVPLRVN